MLRILSSSERIVYLCFFTRSVLMGTDTFQYPISDIIFDSGISEATVKRSLKVLIQKKLLSVTKDADYQAPKTYRINITLTFDIDQKDGETTKCVPEGERDFIYDGISELIDDEGRRLLSLIIKNVEKDKDLRKYYIGITLRNLKKGEDIEKKFLDVVITHEFGPIRAKAYVISSKQGNASKVWVGTGKGQGGETYQPTHPPLRTDPDDE